MKLQQAPLLSARQRVVAERFTDRRQMLGRGHHVRSIAVVLDHETQRVSLQPQDSVPERFQSGVADQSIGLEGRQEPEAQAPAVGTGFVKGVEILEELER